MAVALEDQFSAESIAGVGPEFGSPVGEELFQEDSDVPAHVDAAAAAYAADVARLAHGAVVEATAGLALRSDLSHAMRCLYAARLRTVRHDAACACLQSGYRAAGYEVVREVPTGVGQKRGDLLIAELGKHFDLSIVTLDEVVDGGFPALELGAGLARGVKTAEQERAFRAWRVAAQGVAFGAMARQAAFKRAHHAPAQVTPLILSAGWGDLQGGRRVVAVPGRPERAALDARGAERGPAQVPVQVGVADVESEGPSRAAGGGLVDRLPVRGAFVAFLCVCTSVPALSCGQ